MTFLDALFTYIMVTGASVGDEILQEDCLWDRFLI